jgi:hypothetical protein
VSAEVLYPTRGKEMYRQGVSQEVAEASAHVYNEWMAEFCQEAPARLWGQAEICLGTWTPRSRNWPGPKKPAWSVRPSG